jgi:hypothetical protein
MNSFFKGVEISCLSRVGWDDSSGGSLSVCISELEGGSIEKRGRPSSQSLLCVFLAEVGLGRLNSSRIGTTGRI